jgi:hypothetical protein
MKLFISIAACVLLTGCAGGLAKHLAKDGAIVIVNMGSPWGNQKVVRIGTTTNSVTVSPDGTVGINTPTK